MAVFDNIKNFIRHNNKNAGSSGKKPSSSTPVQAQRASSESLPVYRELSPRYKIISKIGEGAFSKVYKSYDHELKTLVAIKVIDKQNMTNSQIDGVLKEISIMRRLNHPNIVKLYNFINSPTKTFLIIEFVSGGELFNQIVKLTYFSEELSRHIILQVVQAVQYLHSEVGVVHRDIKPENLLFEKIDYVPSIKDEIKRRKSDDANKIDEGKFVDNVGGGCIGTIKLADFGLSKVLWDSNTKTPCGTASYTAPEIVKDESYSKSVDMWAIGCVLYTLLSGFPPFYDSDPKTLTLKVSKGEYTFLSPWWDEISKEAKDLVSHLLTVDPSQRYDCEQVLSHPWILQNSKPTLPAFDAPNYKTSSKSILRFDEMVSKIPSTDNLSPRAEALKFAFDKGISIQRTGTPLKKLLESDYFNESDDNDDDDDDDSDDDDDDDDDDDENDDDDDDDDDGNDTSYKYQPRGLYTNSPILKKFPDTSKKFPKTPYHYNTNKKITSGTRTTPTFKDAGFNLKLDGNTLLNRRKLTGSLACGPSST